MGDFVSSFLEFQPFLLGDNMLMCQLYIYIDRGRTIDARL